MSEHQKYRPLPDCLTISESDIDGVGIFAASDIEEGTDLGVTHIYDWLSKDCYKRTPLGGFLNHSDNPNCEIRYSSSGEYYSWDPQPQINTSDRRLVTKTKIMKGQELTAINDIHGKKK